MPITDHLMQGRIHNLSIGERGWRSPSPQKRHNAKIYHTFDSSLFYNFDRRLGKFSYQLSMVGRFVCCNTFSHRVGAETNQLEISTTWRRLSLHELSSSIITKTIIKLVSKNCTIYLRATMRKNGASTRQGRSAVILGAGDPETCCNPVATH